MVRRWWLGLLVLPLIAFGQVYVPRPPTPPDPEQPPPLLTLIVNVDRIPPVDPNAVANGTWLDSAGTQAYDPTDPTADSVYAADGDVSASFEFRFPALTNDLYTFCAWWSTAPTRAQEVPYRLYDSPDVQPGASVALYISDQQLNAGQWVKLFDYTITSASAVVHLTNENPGVSLADAVMATNDPNQAALCADIPGGVPPPQSIDVIIDNDDPGTTGLPDLGDWPTATQPQSQWGPNVRIGTDSLTPATYEWLTQTTFDAGTYDICMWWPVGGPDGNNTANVTFASEPGLNFTVDLINQAYDNGRWNRLGQVTITTPTTVEVELVTVAQSAFADAIRVTNNLVQCSDIQGPPPPVVTGRYLLPHVDADEDSVPDFRDSCPNTSPGLCVSSNGCTVSCPQTGTIQSFANSTGRGIWLDVPETNTLNWAGRYIGNDVSDWAEVGGCWKGQWDSWTGGHLQLNNSRLWITGGGHNASNCNDVIWVDLNNLSNPFRRIIETDNSKIPAKCQRIQDSAADSNEVAQCWAGWNVNSIDMCDNMRSTWFDPMVWLDGCSINVVDSNTMEFSGCGDQTSLFAVGRVLRTQNGLYTKDSDAWASLQKSYGHITGSTWDGSKQTVSVASWTSWHSGSNTTGFTAGWDVALLQNPRDPRSEIAHGPPSVHIYDKFHYDEAQDIMLYVQHSWGNANSCRNDVGPDLVPGFWLLHDATTDNPYWEDVRHIRRPTNRYWDTSYEFGVSDEGFRPSFRWVPAEGKLWYWNQQDGVGWIDISNMAQWKNYNCNHLAGPTTNCPIEVISTQDQETCNRRFTVAMGVYPGDGGSTQPMIFTKGTRGLCSYDTATGVRIDQGSEPTTNEGCSWVHDDQFTGQMILWCGGQKDHMWLFDPAKGSTMFDEGGQFFYPNGRFTGTGTSRYLTSAIARQRQNKLYGTDTMIWHANWDKNLRISRSIRPEQWIPKVFSYTTHPNYDPSTCTGSSNFEGCRKNWRKGINHLYGMTKAQTIAHLGDNLLLYDTYDSVITGPLMPTPQDVQAQYPSAPLCDGVRTDCQGSNQSNWRGAYGASYQLDADFSLDADHPGFVGDTGGDRGPQSIPLWYTHFDPSFTQQKNVVDDTSQMQSGLFWTTSFYMECEWFYMGPGGQHEAGCEDHPDPTQLRPDGTRKQVPKAGAVQRTYYTESGQTGTHKLSQHNVGSQIGTYGGETSEPGDIASDAEWRSCNSGDGQIVLNTTSRGSLFGWMGCPSGQENWQRKLDNGKWTTQPGHFIDDRSPGADGECARFLADSATYDQREDPDCVVIGMEQWWSVQIEVSLGEWNAIGTATPYKSYIRVWIAREKDRCLQSVDPACAEDDPHGVHTYRDEREWQLHTNWPLHVRSPRQKYLNFNQNAGYGVSIITQHQTDRCGQGNTPSRDCVGVDPTVYSPVRTWVAREVWSNTFIPRPLWPGETAQP